MRLLVLGAGAGGGSPQWNCGSPVSRAVRRGQGGVKPRTQSSIAVTADGERWCLCNASPDLGAQIFANPALHPKELRHSPINSVIVTNGDVDHVAGLLTMRESQPLRLYGTGRVLDFLGENKIFSVLNPQFVAREPLVLDKKFEVKNKLEEGIGVFVTAFAVPGKIALWLEEEKSNFGTESEDTIALEISDAQGAKFFYIPACAAMEDKLKERICGAELVLFDGTLWENDELKKNKVGEKTGQRMGHMNNSGAEGAMAAFEGLGVKRKVFIHINTTNPILLPNSPERKLVERNGWEVAFDTMSIDLGSIDLGENNPGEARKHRPSGFKEVNLGENTL